MQIKTKFLQKYSKICGCEFWEKFHFYQKHQESEH